MLLLVTPTALGLNMVDNEQRYRPVVGFENEYLVSGDGEIYSLRSGRTLKNQPDQLGYLRVVLSKDSKAYTKKVHRLVAESFLEPEEDKNEVNHIDGDKTNNRVSNLEWSTRSDNMKHAHKSGLANMQHFGVGEDNQNAKLKNNEVREIKARYKKGCKQNGSSALAREFGVAQSTMHDLVTGKYWRSI